MQLLNEIISQINTAIEGFFADCEEAYAYDSRYTERDIFNLAEQTIKQNADKTQVIFPTLMDTSGEGLHVTFTDEQALRIYHRVLQMQVNQVTSEANYGDIRNKTKIVWQMTMPVYYNRAQVQVDAHQLALHLIAKFPQTIKIAGIDTINIFVNNVILNPLAVFRAEYPTGVEYFVKTEHSLIAINYTIESTFRQNCFNGCPEEV